MNNNNNEDMIVLNTNDIMQIQIDDSGNYELYINTKDIYDIDNTPFKDYKNLETIVIKGTELILNMTKEDCRHAGYNISNI